ncbi:hypothetical protein B9Z55_000600 [Caenorhabditis nigoni]|uniref:DUF6570 domain-containing protein n=1 Tax=Caenorhabditis nigoni TaxID=1611254 RepID=A0A2G5VTZ4_9PELO|nr:hypothetical protein B9Z55_000600 [Caenorhabditis nigoni]
MSRRSIAFALEEQCQACTGSAVCDDCNIKKLNVCRICIRPIREGEVPQLARNNGLRFNVAAAELKKLHCIESLLIQKARVVHTIVNLKDIGGSIKNRLHYPKPGTLPSASDMRIVVNTEWDKQYLVCIERVLKALTWLKANNPQYHDIHIDPTSTLRLGQDVVFEDSSKTQEDVNSLIRQSESEGGSILEASPVIQPIQPVNQPPGTNLTGLQQYQLKRIPSRPYFKDDVREADVWAFPKLFPTGKGVFIPNGKSR